MVATTSILTCIINQADTAFIIHYQNYRQLFHEQLQTVMALDERYLNPGSTEKCYRNLSELKSFLRSGPITKHLSETATWGITCPRSASLRRREDVVGECHETEASMFEKEGESQESHGKLSLALACYSKAASLLKTVLSWGDDSSSSLLRVEIKRACYLRKARGVYRRMLVQSVQNPYHPVSPKTRRSRQVYSEKRPCRWCTKMVFWLKRGSCSECDLETHDNQKQRNGEAVRQVIFRDFITPGKCDSDKFFVSPSSCLMCSSKKWVMMC